jgi:hypothetical protein
MSKRKTINRSKSKESNRIGWFLSLKRNWLMFLIIGFLTFGALGSGLKYLEQEAMRQRQTDDGGRQAEKDQSFLNKINPFLHAPPSSQPPHLSKEYLYAGSRLLSAEDVNANPAPPADLAVWRPSTGTWWVFGGQSFQPVAFQWGTNGDLPAAGDYDGDGKTDLAVFRPSANQWWVFRSSDNTYYSITYGIPGDKPAQADYNGDGKTDMAIFRPSNGSWYILQNGNNQSTQQQFGLSSDIPAPADFDGDGRADLAVFRESNMTFHYLKSSNLQSQTTIFGEAGDKPVPADYDGDGRADIAMWRSRDATWYILQSSDASTSSVQFGIGTDTPVQNDYDGDGKVDIAVWRGLASTSGGDVGKWFIRNSSNLSNIRTETWGIAADIPVPVFYRR